MNTGRIIGCIIDLAVALACIIPGLLIWKKQKIGLLHDYHYRHVQEEDIPAYTRSMGIGLIIMGMGILVMAAFLLFALPLWWVPMAAGFVLGLALVVKTQKKYNGSIMG